MNKLITKKISSLSAKYFYLAVAVTIFIASICYYIYDYKHANSVSLALHNEINHQISSLLAPTNLTLEIPQLSPNYDASEIADVATDDALLDLDYDETITALYEELSEETLSHDILDEYNYIKNSTPLIAIVIDDMGINQKRTAEISSLAYPLTVSFLTYANHLDDQIDQSLAMGQEIMVHTPMEALNTDEVAPDVLTSEMSIAEIKNNLQLMLQKIKNARGINNHMGSKLTQDYQRMTAVMEVLREYNMFFLDSRTTPQSVADKAAAEVGIKYAVRNVFLDNKNDKEYILQQLQQTENIARKKGLAIAIGHPKSQTFAALKEWLPSLPEKGLKLVHLSTIINLLNN